MKKVSKLVLIALVVSTLVIGLAGCGAAGSDSGSGSGEFQIAVPSDTTNEARALLLLEEQGLIKLKEGAGLSATANDIVENPYNIKIVETEAASLPRTLQDVDMAVINGNYALSAGLDPASALAGETSDAAAADEYGNVIAVRAEDAGSAKTIALVEALQSDEVKQYIADTFDGAVVSVDIDALPVSDGEESSDKVIKVGASPAPHAQILEFAKPILEKKGYTLEIIEYSDYIQPNVALNDGDLDANYFQHYPYLEDYNKENGTTLASAGKIHFEPLCLYPGKTTSIADIKG